MNYKVHWDKPYPPLIKYQISCQQILFTCLCSPCHYNNQAELNFIYISEMCSWIRVVF